jgi:hypothetical protein
MSREGFVRRHILMIALIPVVAFLAMQRVQAQDPGAVADAKLFLRADPSAADGVQVVVSWVGHGEPDVTYQVWRRTPWDLRLQETAHYADVPASAVLPDGTFEFVDPDPFGMPDRPCYMVGATRDGDDPRSFALPGCIPTLPAAMAGLSIEALPGPGADSWYITGIGFAPGAIIVLQELSCDVAPCPGPTLSVSSRIEAGINGRFSVYTALPPTPVTGTRTIVAYEAGWLPSQFPRAPVVEVPAAHPGAALGYPLSTRTGNPAVDVALAALQSEDIAAIAALFLPREMTASDGSPVLAMPLATCGSGDYVGIPAPYHHVARDLPAERIYAVFEVAQEEAQWAALLGATHVIVLVSAGDPFPIATMVALNEGGIVGAGTRSGCPPTHYLRAVREFILPPLRAPEEPAPPAVGSGTRSGDSSRRVATAAGALLLAAATLTAARLAAVAAHQRRG